jgi:ubiquinone/menaquinone biosynthesis C-methylase UbiE
MYTTVEARREFDNWAPRYDRDPLQWLFFRPTHRRMLKWIGIQDERILDVGCGTGQFAVEVLRHNPRSHVVGLDLCESMLARAGTRACQSRGAFSIVRGDSQKLPFADNYFDLVTCSHSFHHYPDQVRVIEEMHRVLRPGGRLFLADGDRDRLWGRLIFDGIVVALEGAVRHLSLSRIRQIMTEAGFDSIEQVRRGGLLPFAISLGIAHKPATAARRLAG